MTEKSRKKNRLSTVGQLQNINMCILEIPEGKEKEKESNKKYLKHND